MSWSIIVACRIWALEFTCANKAYLAEANRNVGPKSPSGRCTRQRNVGVFHLCRTIRRGPPLSHQKSNQRRIKKIDRLFRISTHKRKWQSPSGPPTPPDGQAGAVRRPSFRMAGQPSTIAPSVSKRMRYRPSILAHMRHFSISCSALFCRGGPGDTESPSLEDMEKGHDPRAVPFFSFGYLSVDCVYGFQTKP